MGMQRISLPVHNNAPQHTFDDDALRACESAGACCKCGACCWAHEIDAMPAPGAQLGDIAMGNDGQPLTMKKIAGEFCPHLGQDEEGGLACAIYASPHKPGVCNEWTGNRGGAYRRMLEAVFMHLTSPPSAASIEQAAFLAANNVFALLRRKPGRAFDGPAPSRDAMIETAGDVVRIAIRYVQDLSHLDHGLFRRLGLPQLLQYARQHDASMIKEIIRGLRFADFSREHPVQVAFVETYFEPDEQAMIWA